MEAGGHRGGGEGTADVAKNYSVWRVGGESGKGQEGVVVVLSYSVSAVLHWGYFVFRARSFLARKEAGGYFCVACFRRFDGSPCVFFESEHRCYPSKGRLRRFTNGWARGGV